MVTKSMHPLAALSYELMGAIYDLKNDGADEICISTIERVQYELMMMARKQEKWQGLAESDFTGMTLAQVFAMKYAAAVLKEKNT